MTATVQSQQPARPPRLHRTRTRRRRRAGIAILLALLAIGASLLAWTSRAAPVSLQPLIIVDTNRPLIEANRDDRWSGMTQVSATIDGRRVRVSDSQGLVTLKAPELRDGAHLLEIRSSSRIPWLSDRVERARLVVDTRAPSMKIRMDQRRRDAASANVTVTVSTERNATVDVTTRAQKRQLRSADGRAVHRLTLPAGAQTVEVSVTDAAGNRSDRTERILVDVEAPTASWQAAQTQYASNSPSMRLTVSDNGGAQGVGLTATVDGRPVRVTRTGRMATVRDGKPLSEGRHTAHVKVTDAAGNSAAVKHEFVVDSSEALGQATLREGARGRDVTLLQQELARMGSLESTATPGVYDAATKDAVSEFQSTEGLDVDGVAGPFTIAALTLRIEIGQSDHELVLHRYGRPWRRYPIAVGQPKYPTPNGDFRIVDKQENPTWTPPDSEWAKDAKVTPPGPDNPLGTRWMGLDAPSIGIHGTNSPESLGYSVSHGCIRMSIADVEQLFELVDEGTRVRIRT